MALLLRLIESPVVQFAAVYGTGYLAVTLWHSAVEDYEEMER